MKKAWREIAGDQRKKPRVPWGAHKPIYRGKSTALMSMALKAVDVYDEDLGDRREIYEAFIEVRIGAGMAIRNVAGSKVSQVDAFEAALQHALSRYDARLTRVKIWPLHVEMVKHDGEAVIGTQALIRVRAHIEQDGWIFDGDVEHRDTVKAICLLIFQAYDAHFTEHEQVGLRRMETQMEVESQGVGGGGSHQQPTPPVG